MREPKNQMLGTMEPPLMQLSVKLKGKTKTNKNKQTKKTNKQTNILECYLKTNALNFTRHPLYQLTFFSTISIPSYRFYYEF